MVSLDDWLRRRGYSRAAKLYVSVSADKVLSSYIDGAGLVVKKILKYPVGHDKGHLKRSAWNSVRLLDALNEAGVSPSTVASGLGDTGDAMGVTATAARFHDVGYLLAVPEQHHLVTPTLYNHFLRFYDIRKASIMLGLTLNAMLTHRAGIECTTIEGGCVRIGEGSDLSRKRLGSGDPISSGQHLHKASIEAFQCSLPSIKYDAIKGKVVIEFTRLDNPSALYQLEGKLRPKIEGSGIEKVIEVVAELGRKKVQIWP